MKRYILSVILLGAAFSVKAQQLQTSSMYDMQEYFITLPLPVCI